MITYRKLGRINLKVYLEGKRVGTIRPVAGGYRYFPLGKEEGGELFPDIPSCKRSIEGKD